MPSEVDRLKSDVVALKSRVTMLEGMVFAIQARQLSPDLDAELAKEMASAPKSIMRET